MVAEQIAARGVRDQRVLAAMEEVPRELFVPSELAHAAYADQPLPLGGGQTISQPYVVARMAELAEVLPGDRVLDIGSGSGYQTAVLAALAERVYGIEIRPELAERAASALRAAGISNASVVAGDGGYGLPSEAPFDAIVVAAAAPEVPLPLLEQLADRGRLVMPVGSQQLQDLVRVTRRGEVLERESFDPVRFVAFIGDFA